MPERIFVVGHAAVTCLGRDMNSTWQALVEGRSGIRRHSALGSDKFLQDLGGMVEDFGPGSAMEDPAIAKLAARFIHLSMGAARGHGATPASTGSKASSTPTAPRWSWVRRSAALICSRPSRIG